MDPNEKNQPYLEDGYLEQSSDMKSGKCPKRTQQEIILVRCNNNNNRKMS